MSLGSGGRSTRAHVRDPDPQPVDGGRSVVSDADDLAGVGVGPFNLSIAALADGQPIDARFLEAEDVFRWHPGMMLPDARLQMSPLKDLVTPVEPTNPGIEMVNWGRRGDGPPAGGPPVCGAGGPQGGRHPDRRHRCLRAGARRSHRPPTDPAGLDPLRRSRVAGVSRRGLAYPRRSMIDSICRISSRWVSMIESQSSMISWSASSASWHM